MIRLTDSNGDEIRVFTQADMVWIDVTDSGLADSDELASDFATATLSPVDARCLAAALTRCADHLETTVPG